MNVGDIITGVGDVLLPGVSSLISSLGNLFSGGNPQADEITKVFINYASNNGIYMDSNDVVHLLPSGWGNPDRINDTAKVFDVYIQQIKKNTFSYASFGGGYKPSHAITYNASKDLSQKSGAGLGVSKTFAGLMSNPFVFILLIGAGIFLLSRGFYK